MDQCQFAGRHTPPPGHDGYATYNCTICGAEARPSIVEGVPRQQVRPKPDGFGESVRFHVHNPHGIPLSPGLYVAEMGDPHKLTGIIPLSIVRNVTDDGK